MALAALHSQVRGICGVTRQVATASSVDSTHLVHQLLTVECFS